MKRFVAVALLALAFACTKEPAAPPAPVEPEGFQGVPWGASPEEAKKVLPGTYSERMGFGDTEIAGLPATFFLHFKMSRLGMANVKPKVKPEQVDAECQRLARLLTLKYGDAGPMTAPGPDGGVVVDQDVKTWKTAQTTIALMPCEGVKRLNIYYAASDWTPPTQADRDLEDAKDL